MAHKNVHNILTVKKSYTIVYVQNSVILPNTSNESSKTRNLNIPFTIEFEKILGWNLMKEVLPL